MNRLTWNCLLQLLILSSHILRARINQHDEEIESFTRWSDDELLRHISDISTWEYQLHHLNAKTHQRSIIWWWILTSWKYRFFSAYSCYLQSKADTTLWKWSWWSDWYHEKCWRWILCQDDFKLNCQRHFWCKASLSDISWRIETQAWHHS